MRIILVLFLTAIAASLPGQTLEGYLKMALENNVGIRARQTEYQAARQKSPQAGALPDPTVNASFFFNPMMLPMGNQLGSLSVMQMFPWPGALDAMEKEAAQMAEVKRQTVEVARNELILKIKNAWYPLLELEEEIRIRQENLRVLELDKELATFKFQHGQAPMTDAIRADIMIDELRTEIALLEQKRKPLEVALNRLLNRDDHLQIVIPSSSSGLVQSPLEQRDSLILNNPILAVFDQEIQAAQAGENAAEFMRKPMFGAGLQYMPLVSRKDNELLPNTGRDMIMPMVSISIPVWRKKYDAALEEKRLMQLAYADMKQDMVNELVSMYEMTLYELANMQQMVELIEVQVVKTQQMIDLLLVAYRQEGKEFEEILRAQQQLFDYQLEKIKTLTEYQLALAKLDYLAGR